MSLPSPLLLATGNPRKVAEWRALLGHTVDLRVDPDLPSPDETGRTCTENAALKAVAGARAHGVPALGDDVGLAVAAWGGRPGLELRPWAESLGGWAAARAELATVAGSAATYHCGLALAWPDGRVVAVEGVLPGTIAAARGEGPGTEPCFVPEGGTLTLGELGPERHAHHHRTLALRALRARLG